MRNVCFEIHVDWLHFAPAQFVFHTEIQLVILGIVSYPLILITNDEYSIDSPNPYILLYLGTVYTAFPTTSMPCLFSWVTANQNCRCFHLKSHFIY
jgi:hypothetical protein